MSKHLAMIDRFRCAIELDHPPNEDEMNLINAVCNSTNVEEGLDILRSSSALLSQDGLSLLASCAAGLWRDHKRPDIAYAVSIWALETVQILADYRAEASILLMQAGMLLAQSLHKKALETIERGKLLCSKYPDLTILVDHFAEAERTARQLVARSSLPTTSSCDICGQSFRVFDGYIQTVISHKHTDFAYAAHCFSCSIVVCFACASWQDLPDIFDVGQQLAKDIKMPCCPFCQSPLGYSEVSSNRALFPLKASTDLLPIVDIMVQLRTLLSNEELEILKAVLVVDNLKESLRILRTLLPQIEKGFDERLQNAITALRDSNQSELAGILQAVLHATKWVRDRQNKLRPTTVPVFEERKPKEVITREVIEQQLNRANSLLEQSDLSRALNEIKRAREACMEIGDNIRLARSFLIGGLIYQAASKFEDAIRSFEQCLTIARMNGEYLVAAKAHGNIASCYLQGKPDEQQVLRHSQEALRLYRSVDYEIGIAHTLNNIAGLYLQREDLATALPYLEEAFALKKRLGDWISAADTLGNIGDAQVKLGNLDIGLSLTNEALELVRLGGPSLNLARHLHNTATIAVEANSIQLAIDCYEESLELLEKIRSQISDKYLRDQIMQTYRVSFHYLAKLYMGQQNYRKALEILERIAAVGMCEYMTHPGLMRLSAAHPGGEFIAEFPLPPLNEEAIWSTSQGASLTAIVKYAFVENELYAFMALPNRTVGNWAVFSFPEFGYDALGQWFMQPPSPGSPFSGGWFGPLHDFRGVIKGHFYQLEMSKGAFEQFMLGRFIDACEPKLLEIGAKIFAPLVKHIRESGAKSILFVPIGALTQIPLHAMRWKEEDQEKCILDEFDVYCAPSLRVYSQAYHRPMISSKNALIIADAGNDLLFARTEGRALAVLLSSSKLLEGSAATLNRISKISHSYDIVHFATHAIYDPVSANSSGVCLAIDPESNYASDDRFINSQGSVTSSPTKARYHLVTVSQIFESLQVQPGALVFLSACDSGSSLHDVRGEDFVSLAASFLAAGACAVICAQWPVESIIAYLFSLLFYTHFRSNDSVSALCLAQRELRSMTAEQTCQMWNSCNLNVEGFEKLDISALSEILGRPLDPGELPFKTAYYWGSFALWGCRSDAVS